MSELFSRSSQNETERNNVFFIHSGIEFAALLIMTEDETKMAFFAAEKFIK